MYAYRIGHAPFNPESRTLDINHLKDQVRCAIRMPHTPRAEGYNKVRITGWMLKYDDELRKLGIRWMAEESVKFVDKMRPPLFLCLPSKSSIRCVIRLYSTWLMVAHVSSAIIDKKAACCPFSSAYLMTP